MSQTLIVVGFHGKHRASEILAGHDWHDRRASGVDLSDIGADLSMRIPVFARQRAPRRLLLAAALVVSDLGIASAQAPDSVAYRLLPISRFEVRTEKAGVLGFAGHNHVVRARAFTGSVTYRPGNPSASRLEITIPAESLEVLTPSDASEIRQVTEAMRTDVLHVAQYPEIRFSSSGVSPTPTGFRLDGELTLVGQTRPVQVETTVQVGRDTLRARGTFAVKQTTFGIKPYKGGPGGTVQVADRVTFDFDIVGVRDPVRSDLGRAR